MIDRSKPPKADVESDDRRIIDFYKMYSDEELKQLPKDRRSKNKPEDGQLVSSHIEFEDLVVEEIEMTLPEVSLTEIADSEISSPELKS